MKTAYLTTFTLLVSIYIAAAAPTRKTVGHEPTLKTEDDFRNSFPELADLLESISDDSTVTLFEGLPHQGWEAQLLKSELKKKDSVTRFGFPFYLKPNPVSEADLKTTKAITTSEMAFTEFSGFKLCGAFHPDFALVWKNDNDETELEIHLCFGCGEIKAYRGDVEVHCDMAKKTSKEFKNLLKTHYQKQRPAKVR